ISAQPPRSITFSQATPRPPPTLFPYTTLFRSWPTRRRESSKPSLPKEFSWPYSLLPKPKFLSKELPARSARGTRNSHSRTARKRSEEHTSELQSLAYIVCRLLLEKKKSFDALQ